MYLALLKNPQNSESDLALLYNGVWVRMFVCLSTAWNIDGW